ncbi:MAG: hypothetical protein ACI36X_09395 [Bacteroidaceae bacterium]
MIQRKWTAALALLMGVCGCSDNSYRGTEPVDPDDTDKTRVPVSLSLGKIVTIETTKGAGAIDDTDGSLGKQIWSGSKVNVFAFRDVASCDERATDVSADVSAPGCLIDGGGEEAANDYGLVATVNADGQVLTLPRQIFYPTVKDATYNFFAFFCDARRGEGGVSRTADQISFPIEIDGTNDVMTAYAGRSNFQWDRYDRSRFDDVTASRIESWAYSVYTERRQITPIFRFRHHLVRFRFDLYAGAPEDSVTVRSVELLDMPYKAQFTVAVAPGEDGLVDDSQLRLDFDRDQTTMFTLRERKVTNDQDGNYQSSTMTATTPVGIAQGTGSATSPYDTKVASFGESLLVPAPDQMPHGYQCRITITQHKKRNNGTYQEIGTFYTDMEMKLADGELFKAGNVYTVKLAIFGAKEVKMNTTLTPWNDGGHVDMNEDDIVDYENE